MNLNFGDINYLAVLVTAIAVFLIGGVWYQALFGKMWIALHGFSDEDVKRMQKRYSPSVFFPTMIAAYIVMAFAIAIIVAAFDLDSALAGAMLGIVLWLIVAAVGVTAHITSERHIGLFFIDTAYQLVIFVIAGSILAAWQPRETTHFTGNTLMSQPVVHFEIGSRNHAMLCDFYSKMFDWSISPKQPFIMPEQKESAIGGHINHLGHEPHNYVTIYVQVDDLDAYLKKAASLGGKTIVPPTEVPQMGHFAWMQDPEGNVVGLWKPM